MAEIKPNATTHESAGSFVRRELHGTTFLTLEHIGHMVLTVVLPGVLALAVITAINLWTGEHTYSGSNFLTIFSIGGSHLTTMWALELVAALLVLAPLMWLLEKRTHAEWLKRPGYAQRLAYKVPLYTALGILVTLEVGLIICMLSVVLSSLVFIGVSGVDIGGLYTNQFLPALIAFAAFFSAKWYLFRLAKGRDLGRGFNAFTILLSAAAVVALLITAAVVAHDKPEPQPRDDYYENMYEEYRNQSSPYDDLFNQ